MDESQKEADYKKELEAAGVELPVDDSVESPKEEPEKEIPKEPEGKPEEPEKLLETEPREKTKRSIYDDLKEKKADLRSEKEAREEAERERDELKAKLSALNEANSPDEKREAANNAMEYAEQVGADPELVKRIIEEARQSQQQIDPELRGRLDKFEQWQKQNAHVVEKQMFEEEFARTVPSLRAMFPDANTEELGALKSELDKLSHSKEMHDKELDYVAFKHKEHLSAFISPQKRGMESRGRNQQEDNSFEFDGSADLSKMTAKQLEAWEATYNSAVNAEKGVRGSGKQRQLV